MKRVSQSRNAGRDGRAFLSRYPSAYLPPTGATAAIGFGILLSASGLLLEEMSFHTYADKSDVLALAIAAVFANLGVAQLDAVWRSMAMLQRKQDDASPTMRPEQT